MVRKIGADPRFSRKDQGRIFTGSSWVMRSISQRLLPAQEPPCSAWLSQGRCSLLARCNSCPRLAVELIKEIFLQNGVAGGFCQALAFQFGGFWDKRCRVLPASCVQLCQRGVWSRGDAGLVAEPLFSSPFILLAFPSSFPSSKCLFLVSAKPSG